MYAIHIADLLWLDRECPPLRYLLAGKFDLTQSVELKADSVDGVGVAFACPDEQAEAIISLIHQHYNIHMVRIFHRATSRAAWRKVRTIP